MISSLSTGFSQVDRRVACHVTNFRPSLSPPPSRVWLISPPSPTVTDLRRVCVAHKQTCFLEAMGKMNKHQRQEAACGGGGKWANNWTTSHPAPENDRLFSLSARATAACSPDDTCTRFCKVTKSKKYVNRKETEQRSLLKDTKMKV